MCRKYVLAQEYHVSRNDPMVRVLKGEQGKLLLAPQPSFKERPDGEGTERHIQVIQSDDDLAFQGTTRW